MNLFIKYKQRLGNPEEDDKVEVSYKNVQYIKILKRRKGWKNGKNKKM